jgi:hypothetical protein
MSDVILEELRRECNNPQKQAMVKGDIFKHIAPHEMTIYVLVRILDRLESIEAHLSSEVRKQAGTRRTTGGSIPIEVE